MAGFFSQLKAGLSKTRQNFVQRVEELLTGCRKIDEELYEELEEVLLGADVGFNTSIELVNQLRQEVKARKISESDQLTGILMEKIEDLLGEEKPLVFSPAGPSVFLVVGVNGVGKTPTIGKLAGRLKNDGKRVILAAGDTFRAAAIDQLEIWVNGRS